MLNGLFGPLFTKLSDVKLTTRISPNFLAESYYDHRIAMSFAIAGLNSDSSIEIASPESINTSFPEFIELGKKLGCNFEIS